MTPFYSDAWLTVYGGDCREVLRELPAESVHCVITSPPYWGLRDYGQDGQLGLEQTPEEYVAAMVDVFREVRRVLRSDGTVWLNLGDSYASHDPGGWRDGEFLNPGGREPVKGQARNRSGNYRPGGLKPKDLVGIPWRVAFALQADGWYLRSDIIWSKPNAMPESVTDRPTKSHEYLFLLARGQWKSRVVQPTDGDGEGLHLGSDFRPTSSSVRLADADFSIRLASAVLDCPEVQEKLRLPSLDAEIGQQGTTDIRRSAIGDLPVAHRAAVLASRLLNADISTKEFLRQFHSFGVALADGHDLLIDGLQAKVPLPPGVTSYGEGTIAIHYPGEVRQFDLAHNRIVVSTPSTCTYYFDADAVREVDTGRASGNVERKIATNGERSRLNTHMGSSVPWESNGSGRNIRSVWTIATAPYPGAHFATFPPKLVEPCVKAGTSERGVCPECGAPLERVIDRVGGPPRGDHRKNGATGGKSAHPAGTLAGSALSNVYREHGYAENVTTGWRPTCRHEAEPVPAVVLDPFAGTGTVGMVAQSLSRRAILVDLNPDYLRQCLERNRDIPLGLPA